MGGRWIDKYVYIYIWKNFFFSSSCNYFRYSDGGPVPPEPPLEEESELNFYSIRIVVASFLTQFCVLGILYSYGVFQVCGNSHCSACLNDTVLHCVSVCFHCPKKKKRKYFNQNFSILSCALSIV